METRTKLSESNDKHEMAAKIVAALQAGGMTGSALAKAVNALATDDTFATYRAALELAIGRQQIERFRDERGLSYRLFNNSLISAVLCGPKEAK